MADLAAWKIRKIAQKIPYTERTYTLETNPEYQKGRRMMAFIMNMWKGRIIRSGLDMQFFTGKLYKCLEKPVRERRQKEAGLNS